MCKKVERIWEVLGEGKEYEQNILYELRKQNIENFPECQSFAQYHDSIKIIFSSDKVFFLTYFIQYFTLVNLQFLSII